MVVNTTGLGLRDPPWVNTRLPPHEDQTTFLTHSPVLLTPGNAEGFMEVTAMHGCCVIVGGGGTPPLFLMIPLVTVTSFSQEFGYSDSEHDTTAPPDDRASPDTMGAVGPTAVVSLQALLINLYESMFGAASENVADNTPLQFWKLFSEGACVVDRALMEIRHEQVRHKSALDRKDPSTIAESIECTVSPSIGTLRVWRHQWLCCQPWTIPCGVWIRRNRPSRSLQDRAT